MNTFIPSKETALTCNICQKSVCGQQNWKQHIHGRKHQLWLPKELKITGVPPDINDLEDYERFFQKYGKVKFMSFTSDNTAILFEFENKNSFTELCHLKAVLINNKVHNLSWPKSKMNCLLKDKSVYKWPKKNEKISTPSQSNAAPAIKTGLAFKNHIISKILKNASTEDQLYALARNLQHSSSDSNDICKIICDDIKPILPFDSKILLYGSRLSNLHFENSDVNLYITNVRKDSDDVVKLLTTLKTSLEQTEKFGCTQIVESRKQKFLRAVHKSTKLPCEISVNDMIPVYNSEFLRYYFSLEPKLVPLVLLIKFWFFSYNMIKKPSFMYYDLYQMIIFYLQQPPLCFPSVYELQKGAMLKTHDGWQFGFCTNASIGNKLENMSLFQLFSGFFTYYKSFNYLTHCICPFTGQETEKTDFFDNVPESYQILRDRIATGANSGYLPKFSLTIQDPFEHDKTTGYIPYFVLPKMKLLMKGVLIGFTKKYDYNMGQIMTQCYMKPASYYTMTFNRALQNETEASNMAWIDKVKNMFIQVMSKVFYCNVIERVVDPKAKPPPYAVSWVSFKCTGELDVWQNRMTYMRTIWEKIKGMNSLEREIAITEQIVKDKSVQRSQYLFTLLFKLNPPCRVIVQMKQPVKKGVGWFDHVRDYLEMNLGEWIDALDGGRPVEKTQNDKPVIPENNQNSSIKPQPAATNQEVDQQVPSTSTKPAETKPIETINLEVKENKPSIEIIEIDDDNDKDDKEASEVLDEILLDEHILDGLDVIDACDDDQSPIEDSPPRRDIKTEPKTHSRSHSYKKSSRSPIRRLSRSPYRSYQYKSETPRSKTSRSPIRRLSRSPHRTYSYKSETSRLRNSRSPIRRRSRSPIKTSPYRRGYDRNRSPIYSKKRRSRSRSPERMRRDPEKTRRDIHRDKIKCAKDEEKKMITNKLEMVKTGLVPPGMEMETEFVGKKIPTIIDKKVTTKRPAATAAAVDHTPNEREWARKRARNPSPRRDNLKQYHQSFLSEIRAKLNEVQKPEMPVVQQQQQQFQQPQQYIRNDYDEQFFVGNQFGAPQGYPMNNTYIQPQPQLQPTCSTAYPLPVYPQSGPPMQPQQQQTVEFVQMAPQPQPPPPPVMQPPPAPILSQSDFSDFRIKVKNETQMTAPPKSKEELGKLFEDKKISLSDFLTVSAKPEVRKATTEEIQKKIQTISKVQAVIKAMNKGINFTGGLIVYPTRRDTTPPKKPFQSPLHRTPNVRFKHTMPNSKMNPYTAALVHILKQCGIPVESVDLEEGFKENLGPELIPSSSSSSSHRKSEQQEQKQQPQECGECKKRKLIEYVSVGTQVNDDDLAIPKLRPQESLVYMTPAQLLQSENMNKPQQQGKFNARKPFYLPPPSMQQQQQAPQSSYSMFDNNSAGRNQQNQDNSHRFGRNNDNNMFNRNNVNNDSNMFNRSNTNNDNNMFNRNNVNHNSFNNWY